MLNPRPPLSVLLGVLTLAQATDAFAVELNWQAPQECPSRETVARDVARLAGAHEGQSLVASLIATRTPDNRWRVTIGLSGSATGHRELTADNCAQLARAAALIIALAANPDAALDLPTESPETPAAPSTVADLPLPAPNGRSTQGSERATERHATGKSTSSHSPGAYENDAPVAADDDRRAHPPPTHFSTFAGLGYDHGTLPTGAAVARFGGSVLRPPLHLSLALDLTAPARAEFVGGIGARLRSVGAEILGCVEPFHWFVHAAACVGPRFEILLVKGYGTDADLFQYTHRFSAVFATEFTAPLSRRFDAGIIAELLTFTRRPNFVIENVDTVLYKPEWFGFRIVATAVYRL